GAVDYWQRPFDENAVGAKCGRPAPGEHREGAQTVEEPGEVGHLTTMEVMKKKRLCSWTIFSIRSSFASRQTEKFGVLGGIGRPIGSMI
ncbi:hypothetical protein LINPERPRIM_LOCUS39864, partial [Linum perenne]